MTSQYDRHMSILFDQPSQSGAAFAGERTFSKSRGLSASVFFLPFPLPLSHFLALVSFLARSKPKVPFLGISLLRNQTETLVTQAKSRSTVSAHNLRNARQIRENKWARLSRMWHVSPEKDCCAR